jgi:hypothetical protein
MRCKSAERAERFEQIIHKMGMDSDYSTFSGSLAFELSTITGESSKFASAFPHHIPRFDVSETESSKIVFVVSTIQNSKPTIQKKTLERSGVGCLIKRTRRSQKTMWRGQGSSFLDVFPMFLGCQKGAKNDALDACVVVIRLETINPT